MLLALLTLIASALAWDSPLLEGAEALVSQRGFHHSVCHAPNSVVIARVTSSTPQDNYNGMNANYPRVWTQVTLSIIKQFKPNAPAGGNITLAWPGGYLPARDFAQEFKHIGAPPFPGKLYVLALEFPAWPNGQIQWGHNAPRVHLSEQIPDLDYVNGGPFPPSNGTLFFLEVPTYADLQDAHNEWCAAPISNPAGTIQ